MGMFDTIAWGDSVPTTPEMDELGLNKRDWEFQTKEFDCLLDLYFVQDGRLYIQKYRESKIIEGDPNAKNFLDKIGYVEPRDPYKEFVPRTATIWMCDYRENVMDVWDCWIEYEVVFKDGIVDSIKLFKFEKRDNAERKERDRKFTEKMKYEQSRWINRYFFYTLPYRKFAQITRRILYTLAELIYKLANKL